LGAFFHYLPEDPLLWQKWLEFICCNCALTLSGVEVIQICSTHFIEESFLSFIQKALGFTKKLILKPDAIPTVSFSVQGHTAEAAQSSQPLPNVHAKRSL
uniref:THAP-type domain-containing protein n=1 Tax=Monopterus albus TaxID=43700 RepID=A0A3Q3IHM3_MONAL